MTRWRPHSRLSSQVRVLDARQDRQACPGTAEVRCGEAWFSRWGATGEGGRAIGGDYYAKYDPERAMRRITRQANALGFTVRFDPIEAA
ncbi:hypothetical protein [Streptomyces sp. NPDC001100]